MDICRMYLSYYSSFPNFESFQQSHTVKLWFCWQSSVCVPTHSSPKAANSFLLVQQHQLCEQQKASATTGTVSSIAKSHEKKSGTTFKNKPNLFQREGNGNAYTNSIFF